MILSGVGAAVRAATAEISEEPFAPRSGPGSGKLFTALPAEQTGVITENRYADPQMWGERYQEFALGAIGTGVAPEYLITDS